MSDFSKRPFFNFTSVVIDIIILGIAYFLIRNNQAILNAFNQALPVFILLFSSIIYIGFFLKLRPGKTVEWSDITDESIFTMKYGTPIFIISSLILIIFSIYLAIAFKWYLLFTPVFFTFLSHHFSEQLKRPIVLLLFLVFYIICFVLTIVNIFG